MANLSHVGLLSLCARGTPDWQCQRCRASMAEGTLLCGSRARHQQGLCLCDILSRRAGAIACSALQLVDSCPVFAWHALSSIERPYAVRRYTGQADWSYIGECAEGLAGSELQLIGNGDVFTWQEYEGRLQAAPQLATAMVARAALIKPWIFTEVWAQRSWPDLGCLPIRPMPAS